jgi:tetratricopeptide (TPR) repeat protein
LNPESILAFRKAIALDSTFAVAYLPLAVMLAAENDPEALFLISNANKFANRATIRERLFINALYTYLHKNYEESYNNLIKLVKKYPDDKQATYWLGWQTLHTHDQPEKAIGYFSKVLELDSLFMNAYDQTAKAYVILKEYKKALWYLNRYIDMNPNDVFPYFTRGKIHYWNHDYEKAIQDLKKSVQLKSNFYQSHEYLAPSYLRTSEFDKAKISYRILASDHENKGKRSDARTGLALVSMFQGKLDEALNILSEGIRQDSLESTFHGNEGDMAYKYLFKAKIYLDKEYSDSALYFVEQCINTCYMVKAEDELCFAQYLVEFLARTGEYTLAEQKADDIKGKLTDADLPLGLYWYARACIEQSRGNLEEAGNYVNQALETGGYFEYLYKRAKIYLASNHADKALEAFNKIKAGRFFDYRPLLMSKLDYYLGQAYELGGQNSKAIEHYDSFLNKWKDADNWIKELINARERLSRLTEE